MVTFKVLKYVVYDVLRSRMVIAYALLLFIFSYALFYLESDPSKSVLSLLNIILLLVPLVSIIFGTIHFYNSKEFIEMLLAQPMSRRSIFFSEFFGLSVSLTVALVFGVGIPAVDFRIQFKQSCSNSDRYIAHIHFCCHFHLERSNHE